MDYLLFIDTSADMCSIAISGDGKILDLIISHDVRNHAASINTMMAQALEAAHISIQDLCAVVVCSGPGSYTGLRIGMATAKGICYAANKPMILDNKLYLLAAKREHFENRAHPKNTAAILVAREKEYFVGIYNNENVCILEPKHVIEDELSQILKGIENLHIIANVPIDTFYQLKVNFYSFNQNITIEYNDWAYFAQEKFKCQEFVNIANATPLYLKQVYTHK